MGPVATSPQLRDVRDGIAKLESCAKVVLGGAKPIADKGYFVAPTLHSRPQFDALRGNPGFQAMVAEAEAGRQRSLAAFREAGGERLLGR